MIRNVMGDVVKKGTGRRAKSSLYKIGGKTGTAQVAGVGGYEDKKYIANFCGFAPVDAPRLVVLVSVVDPKGAYYGGKVSAPAVKEIIENALLYMKVPAFNRAGSLAMGRE
jgi:stage V sporulation protein D (sporulation-specific penicillin-binding protein)